MYMVAQISNRINWIDGRTIFGTYLILQLIFFIAAFAAALSKIGTMSTNATLYAIELQQANVLFYTIFFVPSFIAIFIILYLRCKFVEAFKIKEDLISSFFIGLLCSSCSLCQMARHLWEYKNLLDGDGHLDGYMYYEVDEPVDTRSRNNSMMSSYQPSRRGSEVQPGSAPADTSSAVQAV